MFVACFLDSSQDDYHLKRYSLSSLDLFISELLCEDVVAVESTGNTRYFIDKIVYRVKDVKVINPMQFKVISESVKKTDEHDAITIARFLSKGIIPEVRMKDKKTSQIASLCRPGTSLSSSALL